MTRQIINNLMTLLIKLFPRAVEKESTDDPIQRKASESGGT